MVVSNVHKTNVLNVLCESEVSSVQEKQCVCKTIILMLRSHKEGEFSVR